MKSSPFSSQQASRGRGIHTLPGGRRRSVASHRGDSARRPAAPRQLADLISIGPAMLRDFALLGIHSVGQLARQNPQQMYARLSRKTGQRQDPCVLDTFRAAVAQARNPRLPAEQCQWWYWSKKRKNEQET
jgi:pathogenicity locus Cdd1 protein